MEVIMKLTIGENIKRLRKSKNITQEQLAEVVNLSVTAISKWERGETYPDITMLYPLAYFFKVSVDELLGYDEAKLTAEIEAILSQYFELIYDNPKEARKLIEKAYHDYPNNYKIMDCYMWNKAGDMADNNPTTLLAHKDEFLDICEKLIAGCTDDCIRLNVWNMRAKLLHAEGKTEEAIRLYKEKYPNWYHTYGQKCEQLYAKDTPAFRHRLLINIYELSSFTVDKKMKQIWYCDDSDIKQKIEHSLHLADSFSPLNAYAEKDACILEYYVLYLLLRYINRFSAEINTDAIVERKTAVGVVCNETATNNPALQAFILDFYKKEKLN